MARANWPETEVSIVLFSNPWTIQRSFATESWLLVPVVRIVEVLSIFWCSSSVPTIEFYSQLLYLFIDFIASTAPQVDRFQHAKSHIVPSAHHGQRRFWFLEAPSPIRKLQMSRQDRWDHSHWTKLSSFLFFWQSHDSQASQIITWGWQGGQVWVSLVSWDQASPGCGQTAALRKWKEKVGNIGAFIQEWSNYPWSLEGASRQSHVDKQAQDGISWENMGSAAWMEPILFSFALAHARLLSVAHPLQLWSVRISEVFWWDFP